MLLCAIHPLVGNKWKGIALLQQCLHLPTAIGLDSVVRVCWPPFLFLFLSLRGWSVAPRRTTVFLLLHSLKKGS